MTFHRLTPPLGGLPAGYDLINAGLAPAPADGKKIGGPNAGTYFFAWAEDATSANMNRGLKALAENTDALDDTLRRDLAVMKRTPDAFAAVNTSSVTLPAGTYLGGPGYTNTQDNRVLLITVRDQFDRPILSTSGGEVQAGSFTLTSPDALGGGFSTHPVVVTFFPIPQGTTYRVYYGVRENLATLDTDALVKTRDFALIRGHVLTPAEAHSAEAIFVGASSGTPDSLLLGTVKTQLTALLALHNALKLTVPTLPPTPGAADIAAPAVDQAPYTLPAGTVLSQMTALLAAINLQVPAAHSLYGGGGAWADGGTNPNTDVETQLDKIISDLGQSSGTAKIGVAAKAGNPFSLTTGPLITLKTQLEELLDYTNQSKRLLNGTDSAPVLNAAVLTSPAITGGSLSGVLALLGPLGLTGEGRFGYRFKGLGTPDFTVALGVGGTTYAYVNPLAADVFYVGVITSGGGHGLALAGGTPGNIIEIVTRGLLGGTTLKVVDEVDETTTLLLCGPTSNCYSRWMRLFPTGWLLLYASG